jgi:hypothetical protein
MGANGPTTMPRDRWTGSHAMNPDRSAFGAGGSPSTERPAGAVVAFPGPGPRRFRRGDVASDEARGEILLFTGVRYERMPDPVTVPGSLRRRRS